MTWKAKKKETHWLISNDEPVQWGDNYFKNGVIFSLSLDRCYNDIYMEFTDKIVNQMVEDLNLGKINLL